MRRSITPPRSDGRVSPPFTSTTTMPGYAPTPGSRTSCLQETSASRGRAHVPWIPDEGEEVVSGLGGRYGSQSSSPVPSDNNFVVDIMRKTVEELKHLHYPGQPDPSPPPAAAYPAAAYSPGGSSMTRPPPPRYQSFRTVDQIFPEAAGQAADDARAADEAEAVAMSARSAFYTMHQALQHAADQHKGGGGGGGGGVRELPPSPGMHPPPHAVSRALAHSARQAHSAGGPKKRGGSNPRRSSAPGPTGSHRRKGGSRAQTPPPVDIIAERALPQGAFTQNPHERSTGRLSPRGASRLSPREQSPSDHHRTRQSRGSHHHLMVPAAAGLTPLNTRSREEAMMDDPIGSWGHPSERRLPPRMPPQPPPPLPPPPAPAPPPDPPGPQLQLMPHLFKNRVEEMHNRTVRKQLHALALDSGRSWAIEPHQPGTLAPAGASITPRSAIPPPRSPSVPTLPSVREGRRGFAPSPTTTTAIAAAAAAEAASAAATQAAHYAQEVARARGMSPRRHSSSRSLSPAANRVLDQAYNWPHVPRSARRDRSISPQAERPLQRQPSRERLRDRTPSPTPMSEEEKLRSMAADAFLQTSRSLPDVSPAVAMANYAYRAVNDVQRRENLRLHAAEYLRRWVDACTDNLRVNALYLRCDVHFHSNRLAAMWRSWREQVAESDAMDRKVLAIILAAQGSKVGESFRETRGLRDHAMQLLVYGEIEWDTQMAFAAVRAWRRALDREGRQRTGNRPEDFVVHEENLKVMTISQQVSA